MFPDLSIAQTLMMMGAKVVSLVTFVTQERRNFMLKMIMEMHTSKNSHRLRRKSPFVKSRWMRARLIQSEKTDKFS